MSETRSNSTPVLLVARLSARWRRAPGCSRWAILLLALGLVVAIAAQCTYPASSEGSIAQARYWIALSLVWLSTAIMTVGAALFFVARDPLNDVATCRRLRRTCLLALAFWCLLFLAVVALLAVFWPMLPPLWDPNANRGAGAFDPLPALVNATVMTRIATKIPLIGAICWGYRRQYRWAGRELRRLQNHCVNCGYPLTGLPEQRCPECGTHVEFSGKSSPPSSSVRMV